MNALIVLIPAALALGGLALGAFLWSLRTAQYEDMDGAGWRVILDDDDDDGAASAPEVPAPSA